MWYAYYAYGLHFVYLLKDFKIGQYLTLIYLREHCWPEVYYLYHTNESDTRKPDMINAYATYHHHHHQQQQQQQQHQ